jgi:transposase InsO family protein
MPRLNTSSEASSGNAMTCASIATREELRADVIDYIEVFYNSRRQYSYLGHTSPMEFEAKVNVA